MDEQTTETWLSELRGSRPWTEAEARRVIAACEASGEPIAAFARRSGFEPKRVYRWRDRLGAALAKSDAHELERVSLPAFVPVTVRAAPAPPNAGAAVTVCTRDGLRVEVTELDGASAAWVATLVRSLAEVPS
jgi:transposase-like protein